MSTSSNTQWKATKPKEPGWYKTTTPADCRPVFNESRCLYRWWDGVVWSVGVSRNFDSLKAGEMSKLKANPSHIIVWTESEIVERAE